MYLFKVLLMISKSLGNAWQKLLKLFANKIYSQPPSLVCIPLVSLCEILARLVLVYGLH